MLSFPQFTTLHTFWPTVFLSSCPPCIRPSIETRRSSFPQEGSRVTPKLILDRAGDPHRVTLSRPPSTTFLKVHRGPAWSGRAGQGRARVGEAGVGGGHASPAHPLPLSGPARPRRASPLPASRSPSEGWGRMWAGRHPSGKTLQARTGETRARLAPRESETRGGGLCFQRPVI